MEFDDFQKPKLTPEAFEGGKIDTTGLVIPRVTTSTLAANEVIREGETGSVDLFRRIRESLNTPSGQEEYRRRNDEQRKSVVEDVKEGVPDLLLDPTIDDTTKSAFLEGVRNIEQTYKPNQLDRMVEKAIAASSREDETEREHESRLNTIDLINEVNNVKRRAASAINARQTERDQGIADMAVDLAELFVPLTEWKTVADMQRALGAGDSILMGNQKKAIVESLKNMPYNERAKMTERVIEFFNEHGQVILPDGNDLMSADLLQKMLVDNDYSDVERWADNIFGVVDVLGIIGGAATLAKGAKSVQRSKEAADAAASSTKTDVKPTAPSQIIKDANPEQSRAMTKLVEESDGDEAAEALHGTNKTEAVANDRLPEAETGDGTIKNKTTQWGPDFEEPENIRAARRTDGGTQLTSAEQTRLTDKVVGSLENVQGMRLHKESMSIGRSENGQLTVRAMYRPIDSGFVSAARALENAAYAFRNYGLKPEDFTIYRRSVNGWEETTGKEMEARKAARDEFSRKKKKIPAELKDMEYSVGLKYEYEFSPEDLDTYEVLDTGRVGVGKISVPLNFADRATPGASRIGQGSLTQNLLDASSVLHPQIVEPAVAAVDRGAGIKQLYIDLFDNFTKKWRKMDKDRKARMTNYIHEANQKGLKLDKNNLYSRGFSEEEVGLLKEWRRANDIMWWAANGDMVKTLRNQGYRLFTHDSETRLVVKPMHRKAVGPNTQYFDVADGQMKKAAGSSELDELYGRGGTYARLSEPVQVEDQWIDIIKVDESVEGGYMRRLRDDDIVLNYRDGYYPVKYDANYFIEKEVRKADGTKFQKVVGAAKTKDEAEHLKRNLEEAEPGAIIDYRPDRRTDEMKATQFDESGWSLGVNSGMSNQRVRGQRLQDAAGDLHKFNTGHLMDPVNAVAEQIMQVSNRVSMRTYMDTVKKRWIENYADKLRIEKEPSGEYKFPGNVGQIMGKGDTDAQTVADARSLFNYIHSLENGYVNGIDELTRGLLNYGADAVEALAPKGKIGRRVKSASRELAKGNLTSAAKATVFNLYLAANPARQALIQAHQSMQLMPLNPQYLLSGNIARDWWRIRAARRNLTDDAEAIEMYRELKKSGHLDAVEANNLIREDRLKLADDNLAQKAKRIAGAPLRLSRKIGFDQGENSVLLFSWLTHYDLAKKAKKGKKLTARDYEEIAGKSRVFTLAMNRAGDMPYNKNTLSIITQFLQVPHKAVLQQFTNRSLSPYQRVKLGTFNTVMYGVPTYALGNWFYNSFEEGPEKAVIQHGLEHVLLNEVATQLTGQTQQIDWSDLSPVEMHGMMELFSGMVTSDIGEMIANSPSGSLVFGSNPRITETMKTSMRWIYGGFDYEDPELDTKLSDVSIAFANMFSGASNAFKARYAFKTGQKMSSSGKLSDRDVTKFEAAMQFFGFKTMTETGTWAVNDALYGDQSFTETDVSLWYGELKRQLARKNMSVRDRDMAQRIISEGWTVFQDDPYKFRQSLMRLVKNDLTDNEYNLFETILKQAGHKTPSDVISILDQMPDSENKRAVREALQNMGNTDG